MNIMTRRGSKDNIITYEHMCDTTADLANIDPSYITLGSIAIILQGDTGLEVYMANSDKEWVSILTGGGSSSSTDVRAYICSSEEVNSETGLPDIVLPDENTFYFVATEDDETVYNVYKYEDGEWVSVSAGEGGSSPAPTPAPAPEENDVNFYDYDGTLVYSYSGADFLQLEAMPANPDHTQDFVPLTSQGWNWSLSDAKDAVNSYGKVDIGQIYVPTDGGTHIIIDIPSDVPANRKKFSFYMEVPFNQAVQIDWGDNSTPDYPLKDTVQHSHFYNNGGRYDIKINTNFSYTLGGELYGNLISLLDDTNYYMTPYIKHIYIGNNTSLKYSTFQGLQNLSTITFPQVTSPYIDTFGNDSLFLQTNLSYFALPHGCTSIGAFYCEQAKNLIGFSLPKSITQIGEMAFSLCLLLYKAILPNVEDIENYAFESTGLQTFTFNNYITTTGEYQFQYAAYLTKVIFSMNITGISNKTFDSCLSISEYHFQGTTPPELWTAFCLTVNEDTKIYVPYSSDHSVLNAYKTATNWVSLADYIYEEPQS